MTLDEDHDSDISEDEKQYSNLIDAVSELDNTRRVKAATRKEISGVVSEFHLPKGTSGSGDLITINELTNVLKGKSSHTEIGKKVKSVLKKTKTLPKPLEKPVAERIKRSVGYLNVKGQLKKWNAVVEKNRVAEHLSFPLQAGRVRLQSSQEYLSKFKPQTPLEIEMYKILGEEKEEETAEKEKESNENVEFPLTLEEILEKKKELAHIRAKMSYQEAKACRQSKIKSKKYHRILKREKIKQQFKEFEQLVKSDPEAALKKLEQLDKNRAQERASLRHKNTGKWARNLAIRAKYDKDSRKVLAEELKLSRDLTEKVKNNIDSDEDVSDSEKALGQGQEDIFLTSNDNPWALKVSSEVSDFVSNCKKYWEDKNKCKEAHSNNTDLDNQRHRQTSAEKVTDCNHDLNEVEADSELSKQDQISNKTDSIFVCDENKTLLKQTEIVNGSVKRSKRGREKKTAVENNVARSFSKPMSREKLKKNCKKQGSRNVNSSPNSKSAGKVQSTFGSWTVTELDENNGKRKNLLDIDDIFDELDEKLTDKTLKKMKKLKEKRSKQEKRPNKVKKRGNKYDDLSLKMNPLYMRPDVDEELGETTGTNPENVPVERIIKTPFEVSETETPPEIDPKTFIDVKPKKLKTKLPDAVTGEEYIDDEEKNQKMDIVEAFCHDDVIEEFNEMKKEEEESKKKILEVPDALPGWGSWGGTDIKQGERKTKRFTVNMPKVPPKKNQNRRDIIIREKANEKAVDHMVKDIPHPFQSVGAFESNIRQPVGREWVPETAHRKFIKKPVETQLGAVIEPMDENELLRLAHSQKSLYRGIKKSHKK